MQNCMGVDLAMNGQDIYPPSDLYCGNVAR